MHIKRAVQKSNKYLCLPIIKPIVLKLCNKLKICPYEKNKIKDKDVIIAPLLLLCVINLNSINNTSAEKNTSTVGKIDSWNETLPILYENRNNIGNIENNSGWIICGFFMPRLISFA